MRTLFAAVAEGLCSGEGGFVIDSGGDDKAGDSSGISERVGVGDSCARTVEAKNASIIALFVFVVMSSRVDTSLIS